jgi:hypothetical protein
MISGGPLFWEALDTGDFFPSNMGTISTIVASGFICGTMILGLAVLDLVCTIQGAIKASDGQLYRYPLTINFISASTVEINQNKN